MDIHGVQNDPELLQKLVDASDERARTCFVVASRYEQEARRLINIPLGNLEPSFS